VLQLLPVLGGALQVAISDLPVARLLAAVLCFVSFFAHTISLAIRFKQRYFSIFKRPPERKPAPNAMHENRMRDR
jgi:hypothetical protein